MKRNKAMACSDLQVLLSRYQDHEPGQPGQLEPDLREKLNSHLHTCASCQKEWQVLQETVARVKQLPGIEASPYFTARVMGKILEKEKEMKLSPWFHRFPFAVPLPSKPLVFRMVYSLVFVVFLVLGILLNTGTSVFQSAGNTGKVQPRQELHIVDIMAESQDLSLINIQDKTLALLTNDNGNGNGSDHDNGESHEE